MTRFSLCAVAFSCALITTLSGCRSATPPVTYYIINPITAGSVSSAEADGQRTMTVGIRPVELPGYIIRRQMVKRTGQNQLEISSYHRWADYPDRMVQRVLAENLQLLMTDARIYGAPWPVGLKPDVVLDFSFLELIGTTDKKMLLSAVWTITGKGAPLAVQSHRTALPATIPGTGFDDLAAAHSRALEALCREVAESLRVMQVKDSARCRPGSIARIGGTTDATDRRNGFGRFRPRNLRKPKDQGIYRWDCKRA